MVLDSRISITLDLYKIFEKVSGILRAARYVDFHFSIQLRQSHDHPLSLTCLRVWLLSKCDRSQKAHRIWLSSSPPK